MFSFIRISENGSSDIFPVNNLSQTVAVTQHNPSFLSALSSNQLLTRSNAFKQEPIIDSPVLILSSLPNILPYCYHPPDPVKIPLESESGIRNMMRVLRANNAKGHHVTSCSV